MSKSTQEYILWFLSFFAFCLVVYAIIKAIDALTRPSVVWFVIGVVSTLIIEGLICLIFKRRWFPKRNNTTNTKDKD